MKKKKPFFGLTFYITLALIIFIIDIPLPKGVVVWFLYIFPIAGISKTGNKKHVFILTGMISLFLIIGYSLSPDWTGSEYFAVWNRIIGLIALWIFAFILIKRKESDKELKESKRQFASIIDTAMDGIMVIDENQRILLFNKACEDIFNTTAGEAIGESIERFIPQRYHEPHRENIKKFGEDNHLHRMMGQHGFVKGVKSDGEEFPLEASVSQFDIDGKKYYTVVHRDITDRKKAEEALKESEEHFRALILASSQVLYRMSPDWRYMHQLNSTGFLANTEYSDQSWLQKYIPADEQPYVLNAINNAISNKITFELEHKVIREDGNIGWTLSRAIPILNNTNGEIKEWFGTAIDITNRKLAEESLRKSEEKFSIAFRSNPNALVLSRLDDGTIQEVNDTFLELFGYERSEVIGRTSVELNMFASPDDRDKAVNLLRRDGKIREFEVLVKTKTEDERTVLLSSELLEISGRQLFLTTIQDITTRKLVEKALLESENRFRQLAEAMPQLVWTAYSDGTVDYYNNKVQEFEGFIRKEDGSWEWNAVLHEDDLQRTVDIWSNALKTGSVYEITHRVKKKRWKYQVVFKPGNTN